MLTWVLLYRAVFLGVPSRACLLELTLFWSALLRLNGDTELCYVTTTAYEDQPRPSEMDPVRHFKKSRP